MAIRPAYDKFYCVEDVILIPGENQVIYRSADRGVSWEVIDPPVSTQNSVRNLYFFNENIGFVNGETEVLKTLDGGMTWNTVNFPFLRFGVFHLFSGTEGFNILPVSQYEGGDFPTFKGSQSYQTFDGGATWEQSRIDESIDLRVTYFPRRDVGYGVSFSRFYTIRRK